MNECADPGDYHHHHTRERIEAEPELGVEAASLDPSPHMNCERTSRRHREQPRKCSGRNGERGEHDSRSDDVDRAAAEPLPEEQVEYDAESWKQQDQRERWKFNGHRSPSHQGQFVGVDSFTIAKSRNDDAECDRSLGGRHGHHEKSDHLPVHRTEPVAERNECEIDRVQHQFDRHVHHEDVAADDYAGNADRENDRAQRHHVGERDHPCTRRATSAARISLAARASDAPSSTSFGILRASATAPTTAASSNTEVTSNATRYSLNSFPARLATEP